MPYKTVVFDFFGVISSEIAPFWLSERFPADAARRIKSGLIADADRGLITQVEMFEKLAALSGSSPARVEAEWLAYAKLNGDLIAYISAIKRQSWPVDECDLAAGETSVERQPTRAAVRCDRGFGRGSQRKAGPANL